MIRFATALLAALLGCVLLPVVTQAQRIDRQRAVATPVPTSTQRPPRQHTAAVATPIPLAAPKLERPRATNVVTQSVEPDQPPATLLTTVTLGDIGFATGIRFSNLAGQRDIFVPMPPSAELSVSELLLSFDDVSAHQAKRSLEILVNGRSAAAVALDAGGMGRQMRIPLGRIKGHDGFVKVTFVYAGAATQDRCIDVRYIGDSLTLRPESAIEIAIGSPVLDVGTVAKLMPRDVAVVVSNRKLSGADLAAALTVGRTLKASGRRVTFYHGFETLSQLTKREDPKRWNRGLVLVGDAQEIAGAIEMPPAQVAGPATGLGVLAVARADGLPALVVSDTTSVRAARLFSSQFLPAARGVSLASVGAVASQTQPSKRVTFDELAIAPAVVDVFGRADISFSLATKVLPPGTRPTRLTLDLMVAPDGAGEKAVVSIFVNDRLLGSTVAAVNEPTRIDIALPNGMIGANLNVRAVVQRRSAQGDCRFEPQGYPAQVLGSSAVILEEIGPQPRDFSELAAWWANGIEVWLPSPTAERPAPLLSLITDALAALSSESTLLTVKFTGSGEAPTPRLPFIAVSSRAPTGTSPLVQFDRGRIVVADRSGKTLLDIGGFSSGAVAQIVAANNQPGLWLKPLAADGKLPAPTELRFDRGNVAFIDKAGIALAMSTEHDTLVRITYPDQVSWFTVAERFNAWIIGGIWILVTVGFLFVLQRLFRRRAASIHD